MASDGGRGEVTQSYCRGQAFLQRFRPVDLADPHSGSGASLVHQQIRLRWGRWRVSPWDRNPSRTTLFAFADWLVGLEIERNLHRIVNLLPDLLERSGQKLPREVARLDIVLFERNAKRLRRHDVHGGGRIRGPGERHG